MTRIANRTLAVCVAALLSAAGIHAAPAAAAQTTKAQAAKGDASKKDVRKIERKKLSPALEAVRKRMNDKKKVSFKELQSLSAAGEGLASFFLAQRLEGGSETHTIDSVVHYYALAMRQGRTMAVSSLVSNLRAHGGTLSPKILKEAEQALSEAAKGKGKQADDAAFALGELYASGAPFGRQPEKALAMLRTSARLGNADAAFKAGLMLTNGEGVGKDEKAGRELLRKAAKDGNWAAEALLAQDGPTG